MSTNKIDTYRDNIMAVLQTAFDTQQEKMNKAALKMSEACLNGHSIFSFGCSHAGLLALELYYRSGGMANINPIRPAGLCLDIDPATMTSEMERLPEYGRLIIDNTPVKAGDIIIIHSVSGRNTVTVDAAIRAREKGAYVIALTNLNTSTQVSSRHPSGKNLYQVADLVLDNCGCKGDASIAYDNFPDKVAPTSTAVGAAMLNAIVAQTVQLVLDAGRIPPVFVSANLDGGDEHNKKMLSEYKKNIFYMGHMI